MKESLSYPVLTCGHFVAEITEYQTDTAAGQEVCYSLPAAALTRSVASLRKIVVDLVRPGLPGYG